MYNSPIMILFGAGASIPVEIPGMVGMARRFRKDLDRRSKEQRAYDTLRKLGAGQDLEELLQLANEITQFPNGNLSNLIDESLKAGLKEDGTGALRGYRRHRNGIVRDVAAFRERLLDWITGICMAFDKEEAAELYGEFIRRTAMNGYPVFTTNYDGVLEHVARDQGIAIVDNFKSVGNRSFWDETLASFQGKGFRLVKIHGSIYWHADRKGRIERIDPPAPRNSDGEEVERLIIVPTRFKDIYTRNYFPLYTSFLRSLGAAQVLVVVGHSLRDDYLLAAIRDRLRDPDFTIVLVDPSLPMESELRTGARRPDRQILHVPTSVAEVTGLLDQVVDGRGGMEAVEVARNAVSAVKKRTKPRVDIELGATWLEAGKTHTIPLRIRTTRSQVVVDAWLDEDKSSKKRKVLRDQLQNSWDGDRVVPGFQEVERSVRIYLGKNLGRGPHRLSVVLRLKESRNTIVARDTKNFRLKGV